MNLWSNRGMKRWNSRLSWQCSLLRNMLIGALCNLDLRLHGRLHGCRMMAADQRILRHSRKLTFLHSRNQAQLHALYKRG
uniref:mRNA splicing factor n=1 Tax=Rhizophora mucronata TaxID=61149 RepID=A0A2P2IPB4_RHIMU